MPSNDLSFEGKTVLVTGANRGIGRALVTELLDRGAARVYAATRQPIDHPDERVVALRFDVTDEAAIAAAAERAGELDVLINNAGISVDDDLSDRELLERHLAVNLYGPYGVTQAFLPALERSQGAIVNVLSLAAVAALPIVPAYSVSKAAAFSLSQSLRALLAGRGVSVQVVLPGPVDTDMTRDLQIPKASPEAVAAAILDGVQRGEEEIFPDPVSGPVAEGWRSSAPKALEGEFAAFVQPQPAGA